MSANRSRQAQKLAALLSVHTHTKVTIDYRDSVNGRGRAWHIHWTDGPTWRKLLAVAAGLADEVPSMDVAHMQSARAATPLAEAAAVLAWLNEDQGRADFYPGTWPQYAYDAVSYPERLSEPWQRRAAALMSLTDGRFLDSATLAMLDDRLRVEGWPGVLDWLDEMASGERRLRAV